MALFVGRLPPEFRSRDLEDLFYKFGRIYRCDVKSGISYSFGFVEFEDRRDAQDAIRSLDGTRVAGTRIVVEWGKSGGARRPGGGSRRGGSPRRRSPRHRSVSPRRRSPSPRRRSRSPRRVSDRSPSPVRNSASPRAASPAPRGRSFSRSPRDADIPGGDVNHSDVENDGRRLVSPDRRGSRGSRD